MACPTIANDSPAVYFSQPSYVGSTFATTSGSSNFVNSPFTASMFGNSASLLQMRTVAFGIRVRYTGTELNLGGRVVTVEQPNHETLDGLTIGSTLSFAGVESLGADRDWKVVTSTPINAEHQYTESHAPTNRNCDIGCIFDGVAGNTFEYECFHIAELIGQAVASQARERHTHDGLLSAVASRARKVTGQAASTIVNNGIASVRNKALSILSDAAKAALPAIADAAPMLLA